MISDKTPNLFVKVADTPESQSKGLMFVKQMSKDQGMLFIFGSAQPLSFWGRNTYIALDIAFVDNNNQIKNIETIIPLSEKAVKSAGKCKYAIEANLGFFEDNGVRVGDRVVIDRNNTANNLLNLRFLKKSEYETQKRVAQVVTDEILKKYPTLEDYYKYYDEEKAKADAKKDDEQSLPVLGPEELGQYIEDSIEEQREQQEIEGLEPTVPPTLEELEPKSVDQLEKEIPRFDNISDAFNWGVQNRQVMKISYQTITKKRGLRYFGNRLITRYIEPHGRYTSRPQNDTSHQILVTYDQTAGGIRAFRMQNVREFSFVGRNFKPKFVVRG